METTLLVSAPMLLTGLAVGLMVSIFQTVTQIQEMTLTFIPKIAAVFAAILIFFPWMLEIMVAFTSQVLSGIPDVIRK